MDQALPPEAPPVTLSSQQWTLVEQILGEQRYALIAPIMRELLPQSGTGSVILAEQQWTLVLNILAEQPFKIVAPVIAEITRQWQAAQNIRSFGDQFADTRR